MNGLLLDVIKWLYLYKLISFVYALSLLYLFITRTEGGSGVVYHGVYRPTSTKVAVKEISLAQEGYVRMAQEEVDILIKLRNREGIIQLLNDPPAKQFKRCVMSGVMIACVFVSVISFSFFLWLSEMRFFVWFLNWGMAIWPGN
jgi:serine/threonine protein kinase